MAGRQGPETRLVHQMRHAMMVKYGSDIVIIKQHGGPYAQAGVSDLLICFRGKFIAVEVKSPDTNHGVTVKQQAFLETVREAGGISFVCYSVDDLLATLDEFY